MTSRLRLLTACSYASATTFAVIAIGTAIGLAAVVFAPLTTTIGTAQAQDRFDFRNAFGTPGDRSATRGPEAPRQPFVARERLDRPKIRWRVENPFRFFTNPDDADLHREVYESLPPEQRRSPILSAERTLGQTFRWGWAAELKGRVCWDPAANLHRCPGGGDYVNPKRHRVLVRVAGIDEAETIRCIWRVRLRGSRRERDSGREKLNGRTRVTRPCHQAAVVDIPYPSGAVVEVAIGGRVIAREKIRVEDLLVVGVGDSFGSGEGNPDVPVRFDPSRVADYGVVRRDVLLAGYPARIGAWRSFGDPAFQRENAKWLDQACHRSLYSHQMRAALQLAIEDPKRAITFLHLACSGAEITRGLFLRYKGHEWVPNPPKHSQISAIAHAQCGRRSAVLKGLPEAYHMRGKIPALKGFLQLYECDRRRSRKIDLMFVSIGGNDIGFARLVANSVLREESFLKRLGGWFGQIHDRIKAETQLVELRQRYKALKRALHYILHVPWNESDRVILTAYPAMALLEDGRSTCPSGKAGMEVFPAFYLSQSRAAESQRAADRLDREMRRAARRNGWSFAQTHRAQFVGRGLCAGYDEVSLSSVDDLRFPRRVDGRWAPFNPADYRPYAPRQRWFRTPNDAYLTGHFHVAGRTLLRVLQNRGLEWTQVLLASTYSGAFHPTAEGHAAIADSVAQVARRVLEKYSGGNLRK
ncbi:MAG: hypothetical protein AAFY53_05730 [Pseudomonadota bacterium]